MSAIGNFVAGTGDMTARTHGASSRPYPNTHLDDTLVEISPSHEQRTQAMRDLARQLSQSSMQQGDPIFSRDRGPDFDPFSPKFDARRWVRSLAELSRSGNPDLASGRAGVAFESLSVHGYGSNADYQRTVGNVAVSVAQSILDGILGRKRKVQILQNCDGILEAGEMLVVLGPPGSGCTTLLKTLAGERNCIYLDDKSELNYMGIPDKQMRTRFRGEAIYTAEVDIHFPKLTVGQTLSFAARARAPRTPPAGLGQAEFADHMRDMVMAVFGITHTINTVVGNDFVRGVSGGERKRVTIAEAALSAAPFQCWDNSTRGLDSANAIDFCKNLRMSSDFFRVTSVVAIYQAPQAAYDVFDKVSVLYEGQQIFFGKTTAAKEFFVNMGFYCPEQQTTPDFLTSLSNPSERRPRHGFEGRIPGTPLEFAKAWQASPEYAALRQKIAEYNRRYPQDGTRVDEFQAYRRSQQSRHMRPGSPYTLSYLGQVKLNYKRAYWRWKADPSITIVSIIGNMILALIVGSLYYDLQPTTASLSRRGALIFFAVLLNAFGSALEIVTLYAQRPITEKHDRYAFYHASTDALATIIHDLPWKILSVVSMNLTLYFMTNLNRHPGNFFFYLFASFLIFMTMTFFFRAIASSSRTLTQALAPSAVILLAMTIYTGYAIPIRYMHGWARWINYIDPVGYGFEALLINELAGRQFSCSTLVPSGPNYQAITLVNQVCTAVGSVAGSSFVSGTRFLQESYAYAPTHKWRNIGIVIAFMLFFLGLHLFTTEMITARRSKGEILLFPRGRIPKDLVASSSDEEKQRVPIGDHQDAETDHIQKQEAIFSWKDVVYDIKIRKETRRILDHVDGWVKPGTLTALMGVSGAGKTTLLDVLATRVTMGVVTGEVLVDGQQRDVSFQRKTGYVQQQDVHLQTSTVREALRFSAVLRQPHHVLLEEKYGYVEEVLKLLDMSAYGDAVVGLPGNGLNVEQRKRLTIGVELVAKPALLLFLDEPTSGLDSQTSWNILQLLRKLTEHGQAILCTIHQPSAQLFEQFDRLLFLAKGGKTVYFGPVGKESRTLMGYFVRNGASPCLRGENPAEWMLNAIGASRGSSTTVDWHQTWKNSPELALVHEELARIKYERPNEVEVDASKVVYTEFAAPYRVQLSAVLFRVSQQYWRTPSYIWPKFFLCGACALFIGFSYFREDTSQQGIQNQLLGVFMIFTIFSQLIQQIMPNFVIARDLYEARERPSKTYSWHVFIVSMILVEIPWAMFMGTLMFFCWFYPIGAYKNALATHAVHLRSAMVWLFLEIFLLFASTFSLLFVAGMDTAETASNVANLMFSMCLIFCGVLVSGPSMPGFWKFMWHCTPFTYIVEGMITSAVADAKITCSSVEYVHFNPPKGETCGDFMAPYILENRGYLVEPMATSDCSYCTSDNSNELLARFGLEYGHAWRDFGILWAYLIVNVAGACFFYWFFRVPKHAGKEQISSVDEPTDQKMTSHSSTSRVS